VSSRGTPVWLHSEVAKRDVKITIGQSQANHWGAGGGGKLILPGVVSDETIESNHCSFVTSPATHYGAVSGPMRSDIDEVAAMCSLDATLNVVLDTRGRVIFVNFGSHPGSHREAITYFNSIYAYESPVPEHGQADIAICGVFAPTDHLFFHTGWGCMSTDMVLKDRGTMIYCSPSPGVHTEVGDFPGLALMDLMKPYMPPTAANYERVLRDIHHREIQMWAGCIWVPIYEVMIRKHLKLVTLAENLEMAADIGIDATTSLDEAFAEAMAKHGPDAKVIVLPFARYQLPKNAIRMSSEPLHLPEHAHA
jgi:lactate racemase